MEEHACALGRERKERQNERERQAEEYTWALEREHKERRNEQERQVEEYAQALEMLEAKTRLETLEKERKGEEHYYSEARASMLMTVA